jgi:glycine betaine/choline ABC-type transport system substrate-binding protein
LKSLLPKYLLALTVFGVALARIKYFAEKDNYNKAFDETTLIYIAVAIAVLLVPWERIASFKAGPLELEVSELKDTQQRLSNVTEDMAVLVNRVEQALIPIIGGDNPHQLGRLEKDRRLVIGSKEFSEQIILGNLLVNWISDRTKDWNPGIGFELAIPNGGTMKNWADLANGWIDGYVEYTGTGAMLLQTDIRGLSIENSIKKLNDESEKQGLDIKWLEPLGLVNDYVIIMLKEKSEELGIRTLKDLGKASASKLSFCCQMEFSNRPDGLGSLMQRYMINFASTKIVGYPDRYRLLSEGVCHVTAIFRTDPEFREFKNRGLVVELEDTEQFFPQYAAIPVFNNKALKALGITGIIEEMKDCLVDIDMQSKIDLLVNKKAFNDSERCKKLTSDIINPCLFNKIISRMA